MHLVPVRGPPVIQIYLPAILPFLLELFVMQGIIIIAIALARLPVNIVPDGNISASFL